MQQQQYVQNVTVGQVMGDMVLRVFRARGRVFCEGFKYKDIRLRRSFLGGDGGQFVAFGLGSLGGSGGTAEGLDEGGA